ncbi:DUF1566 domain-containing protein [Leptospira sp. 'Mane']|uniref:Lcl C-terminal domain-containing protein n=1 Tax=Leptospira sp. 'Mane' TaxID=3387407 RepID=UPI00398B3C5E
MAKVTSFHQKIYLSVFIPAILLCKSPLNNQCDPFSEENRNITTIILRSLLGATKTVCNSTQTSGTIKLAAPTSFNCPSDVVPFVNGSSLDLKTITDGTGLAFAVSPELPSGLILDASVGNITGAYSGFRSSVKTYTISASNSLGSASCSFTPKFMGKPPIKTNISACWDQSGTADPTCTSPAGQDGSLKLGTAIDFTGPILVGSDTITKDNVTGLIWTSCNIGQSGANCLTGSAGTYDFATAQSLCSSLDASNSGVGYANLKGWRVPERDEYTSTIDYNTTNPAIFTTYFPQTVSFNYKTNTIPPTSPGNSWYPTFIEGTYGAGAFSDGHYLRCVTNVSFNATKTFIDNQNGTIADLNTSLVWQKCTVGYSNVTNCTGGTATPSNWLTAINTCNSLTLAGKTWRLPNNRELLSLIDLYRTPSPAVLDPTSFPNTMGNPYWTSSTLPSGPTQAWYVGFGLGDTGFALKSTNTNYTRCVSSF